MKSTKRLPRRPKSRTKARRSPNQSDIGLPPRIGSEASYEKLIPHDWTIQILDRKLPAVLATPRMIQMMEQASTLAIASQLEPGTISVGTRIEVDHLKAIDHGAIVVAHARLTEFQGRFLVFDVEARSGEILIGAGKVFRAIVHSANHGDKAKARVTERPQAESK